MKELVFLLEEPSAKEMLEGILPEIIDDSKIQVRYIVFEGKSDLERRLEGKLVGYLNQKARFLVMRDQDAMPDCRVIKQRLVAICKKAGQPNAMVRIACHELETFYLADMAAVEKGLQIKGISSYQEKKGYRLPDTECASPADRLATITKGEYQKVAGSRAIGPYLDVNNERSTSFKNLVGGIRRLIE